MKVDENLMCSFKILKVNLAERLKEEAEEKY